MDGNDMENTVGPHPDDSVDRDREDSDPKEPIDDPDREERVDKLFAEYVSRRVEGEDVDVSAYLERLSDDAERELFRQRVEAVGHLEGLLPRQVREGRSLSGRYRIVRELGSGGMGKVFEAFDNKLGRAVAVKVLTAIDVQGVDLLELFERESRVQAKLRHPGIVPIHEAARDGDVYYLVMDLVEGLSCDRVIARARDIAAERGVDPTRLSLREALELPFPDGGASLLDDDSWVKSAMRVMAETARAIEAAHAMGVIHRDLKPGNVMLRGDGRPVVLDFGLAKRLDQEAGALTRGLFGTPSYLAPEQANRGQAGDDPRSDVYALGLLFYELLTLKPAFPGKEISPVLTAIAHGDFVRPRRHDRSIPIDVETVCLRAMELDPSRRYQSARAFREALEAVLSGERAPLRDGSSAPRRWLRDGRYFARRHTAKIAVAAALLVGVTFGALALSTRDVGNEARAQNDEVSSPVSMEAVTLAGVRLTLLPHIENGIKDGWGVNMRVQVDQPSVVYAVQISGDDADPNRYLSVLDATRLFAKPPNPEDQFGVDVPAGESWLALATVRRHERDDLSRIVVVVTDKRNPDVEAWLAEVAEHQGIDSAARVDYRNAMSLASPELMAIRGGKSPFEGDTPEEREQRARALEQLYSPQVDCEWGDRYSIVLRVVD